CRPQRRDELIHVRPAQRRRALDQLEPVRDEDAHERALHDIRQALDGGAVNSDPFGLPWSEADRQLVRTVLSACIDDNTSRALPEAHDLALVGRPARTAGAAEVQRFDQVRLAGAVWTRDNRQSDAELGLRVAVTAKVTHRDAHDQHPRTPVYTLSLIGMI